MDVYFIPSYVVLFTNPNVTSTQAIPTEKSNTQKPNLNSHRTENTHANQPQKPITSHAISAKDKTGKKGGKFQRKCKSNPLPHPHKSRREKRKEKQPKEEKTTNLSKRIQRV